MPVLTEFNCKPLDGVYKLANFLLLQVLDSRQRHRHTSTDTFQRNSCCRAEAVNKYPRFQLDRASSIHFIPSNCGNYVWNKKIFDLDSKIIVVVCVVWYDPAIKWNKTSYVEKHLTNHILDCIVFLLTRL